MATTLYADDYSGVGDWESSLAWTTSSNTNGININNLWPGSASSADTAVFFCSAGTPSATSRYLVSADRSIAALELRNATDFDVYASSGDGRRLSVSSSISVSISGGTLNLGYTASAQGYYKLVPVTPSFVIASGSTIKILNSLGDGSSPIAVSGGGTLDISGYFTSDARYAYAAGFGNLTVTGAGTTVQGRVANSLGSGVIQIGTGSVVEVRDGSALASVTSGNVNGGSLHVYATNSFSPPTFNVQGGTNPILAKAANVTTPPILLFGATTIQVDNGWVSGGNLGGVTGNGNRLTLSGTGAQVIVNLVENLSFGVGGLTLSGTAPWAYLAEVTLTSTGATIINDGRLDLSANTTVAATSAIQINGASAELLYRTTAVARDIDNAISGTGKITSGRCKFSSMSGFSGSISQTYTEFVDSCEVNAGVYSGALTSGSAGVVWDSDAAQEFAGVINGAGGFTKRNTSVVTLSAANTYAGATTVTAGELVLASGGRCGSGGLTINPSGKVTVQNGGTIGTGGATVLAGELQTHGAQTYPASLTLGTGSTLTIGGA